MSLVLRWFVRAFRKPPVIVFLVLLLGSCLTGYGIIYNIAASHQSEINPNFLHFETDYVEVELPKNWITFQGKVQNTTGLFFSIVSYNPFTWAFFQFQFCDENAKMFLLERLNLTDASQMLQKIINDTYSEILEKNSNVTRIFNENGTMTISNLTAEYSIITLRNVPTETSNLHNITSLIAIHIDEKRLIYISFTCDESNWSKESELFAIIAKYLKLG